MNLWTEAEAKTKWCPFAQTRYGNRVDDGNMKDACLCIGSRCMAWRMDSQIVADLAAVGVKPDGHTRWVDQEGYCGLAGGSK